MKKLLKVLLVVFMVLSLTACGSDKKENDVIVIGGSGPLTGGAAMYGKSVKNSAEMAVEEINALGGLQFKLEFEDDQHDAEKAVTAYGVLKDAGMQISIATVTSAPGAAVSPLLAEDGIFAITPSGSAPAVTLKNTADETSYYGNVFQMCFNDPNQGSASATYIKNNNVGTKVGVIYKSDDPYSTGIFDKFKAKADELGLEYVDCGSFDDSTSTDFSVQVGNAKAAGCDVVFLPIYYNPASLIMTEANKQGYSTVFFGVDGMDGILGLEGFDKSLAEGTYLLTPYDSNSTEERTKAYTDNYIKNYGTDTLLQFGADAYDCIYAIYQACTEGGVTADMTAAEIGQILIKQFTSMTYDGITGECVWSQDGTVDKTPKAVIIKSGAYSPAE